MPDRETKLYLKPQVNISRSTAGRMWMIFFCASLAVIQSSLGDLGASLIVALSALCGGIITEVLITQQKHGFEKVKDGSAAATAVVLALLLPNYIQPVYAVIGAVFAIAVVKHSFGGLGSNWVIPALGGWLFIRFSWPATFTGALEGSPLTVIAESFRNGVSEYGLPPLELLKTSGVGNFTISGSAVDTAVRTFLNNTVFSFFGVDLPAGYIDLLTSDAPGIIADRGILGLLCGTILKTAFETRRSWAPLVYLAVFSLLVWIFGDLPFGGTFWNGDVLFALFSGGALVAAFILVTAPSVGAKSQPGMLVCAALCAVLSWFFRYRSLELYGCLFACALINALTPMVRSFEWQWFYSRKRTSGSPEGSALPKPGGAV